MAKPCYDKRWRRDKKRSRSFRRASKMPGRMTLDEIVRHAVGIRPGTAVERAVLTAFVTLAKRYRDGEVVLTERRSTGFGLRRRFDEVFGRAIPVEAR